METRAVYSAVDTDPRYRMKATDLNLQQLFDLGYKRYQILDIARSSVQSKLPTDFPMYSCPSYFKFCLCDNCRVGDIKLRNLFRNHFLFLSDDQIHWIRISLYELFHSITVSTPDYTKSIGEALSSVLQNEAKNEAVSGNVEAGEICPFAGPTRHTQFVPFKTIFF